MINQTREQKYEKGLEHPFCTTLNSMKDTQQVVIEVFRAYHDKSLTGNQLNGLYQEATAEDVFM